MADGFCFCTLRGARVGEPCDDVHAIERSIGRRQGADISDTRCDRCRGVGDIVCGDGMGFGDFESDMDEIGNIFAGQSLVAVRSSGDFAGAACAYFRAAFSNRNRLAGATSNRLRYGLECPCTEYELVLLAGEGTGKRLCGAVVCEFKTSGAVFEQLPENYLAAAFDARVPVFRAELSAGFSQNPVPALSGGIDALQRIH